MQRFSDYLRRKNEDIDPSADPNSAPSPDSSSSDQGSDNTDPADQKILDACQIAVNKYRSQLEKFLRQLAENDSELRGALDGSSASPPTPDGDPSSSSNNVTRPSADMGN